MSPAFVNRFDIIVLEDQIESITEEEFSSSVNLLMNQPNIFPMIKGNQKRKKKKVELDYGNYDEEPSNVEKENQINNKNKNGIDDLYKIYDDDYDNEDDNDDKDDNDDEKKENNESMKIGEKNEDEYKKEDDL